MSGEPGLGAVGSATGIWGLQVCWYLSTCAVPGFLMLRGILHTITVLFQTHIEVYILPSSRFSADLMYFLSDMQTCEHYFANNPGMTVIPKSPIWKYSNMCKTNTDAFRRGGPCRGVPRAWDKSEMRGHHTKALFVCVSVRVCARAVQDNCEG